MPLDPWPGTTYHPTYKPQNPALSHYSLGWLSCTAFGFAMWLEHVTLGRMRYSGERIRELIVPADTVGGTNLAQMDQIAARLGVQFTPRIGSSRATPNEVAALLWQGRPLVAQGWSGVFVGTRWQTTGSGVNHAGYVSEGFGWYRNSAGLLVPREVGWWDPAGDGRTARWGTADRAPSRIPWSLFLRFAARLDLDPSGVYSPLGAGRLYVGVGDDVEPHVLLRYGGKRTDPWPDRTRANPAKGKTYVNVRRRPDRIDSRDIVRRLDEGDLFTAWQVTTSGARVGGSTHWRGNQDGTEWIPNARLDYIGGGT